MLTDVSEKHVVSRFEEYAKQEASSKQRLKMEEILSSEMFVDIQ
jgi:hypothetical protein